MTGRFPWVVLIAPLLLGGCASAVLTGAGQGGYGAGDAEAAAVARADGKLNAAVNRALVKEPSVSALDIQVQSDRGAVMLTGRVSSREEARRAVAVVRAVPGVETVIDRLEVEP